MDFSNVKFRASSWGNLMSEPRSKADKDAGRLGATCKKELIKIYNQIVYGRKKDLVTKYMDKGTQVEEDGITMFSRVEKKLYYKNEEDMLQNDWFTGHPDIYLGDNILNADEVWDIKNRWDLDSMMPKLEEEVDTGEELQLQVYYSLTGAQGGGIVNTLVSCPENILNDEKRRLLYNMNVISEESPDFKRAWAELEKNLVFEDIPIQERVIKLPVPRNDELIQKMKDKVPSLRNWLQNFHEKHLNLYPK